MAVLENMLHTEPSRTVTSVNNGSASEERIGLWVNVDGGSHPGTVLPKFKRRNVSAIRDFPPGCGRSSTGVAIEPTRGDASEDCHTHSYAGNGGQSLQESLLPLSDVKLEGKNVETGLGELGDLSAFFDDSTNLPDDQIPVVIQDVLDSIRRDESQKDFRNESSDFLDESKDRELFSNKFSPQVNLTLHKVRTYPPPRRVSAVRDFPPLCGRSPRIPILEPNCALQSERLGMNVSLSDGRMLQEPVLGYENMEDSRRSLDHPVKGEPEVSSMEEQCGRDIEIVVKNTYEPGSSSILTCVAPEDNGLSCVPFSSAEKDDSSILACVAPEDNGLSCVPFSSIQKDEATVKTPPVNVLTARKGKKHGSSSLVRQKAASKKRLTVDRKTQGQFVENIGYSMEELDEEAAGQIVAQKDDYDSESDEKVDDFIVSRRPRKLSVNLIPIGCPNSTTKDDDDNQCVTRLKVRETLRLFQIVCRRILREEESKSKEESKYKRVDLQALKVLKDAKKFVNTGKQILGNVPGVEVGDEFQYRVELNVIGLHRNIQAGIDYVNQGGKILATSIVSSGAYDDEVDNSDFLIYTGQGGNVVGKVKVPKDQKLERGNLALDNSVTARNPVRVIRGFKETKTDSVDGRSKIVVTYIYDGLYTVEKSWQEQGQHGKLVFKFLLNRIPGQPELAWKVVKKSKKYEREGVCVHDISQGKEAMPIPAVNTIDDEKPPTFTYITRVLYPDFCRSIPPKGCDCVRKCSDSKRCACAVRNGGEIPFNHNGAIVEAKPLVYECGPHCKCPPSCHNRVSQHGIKFPLEVFKTVSRGWGVRSLASIPSGSFICEYVGELLEDKEADKMTGNDEYLFDIGNNYSDASLCGELLAIMPDSHAGSSEVVGDDGFTIDAAKRGNVGRFINHSCSPNLYAQDVLYDHEAKRIPHIMFFAAENIPPLQELTYHYNYTIDEVRDADGKIKMKSCYCGTSECTGRMY